MKQIYETICLWFFYWLPETSSLRECLEEGMDQLVDDAFWDAIAPEPETSTPWEMGFAVRRGVAFGCIEDHALKNTTGYFLRGTWF